MKQILVGIQELLDNPNNADAANNVAYNALTKSKAGYKKRVLEEVQKYNVHAGRDDDVIVL